MNLGFCDFAISPSRLAVPAGMTTGLGVLDKIYGLILLFVNEVDLCVELGELSDINSLLMAY